MEAKTPMKAIRLKCLDCCAGQILEINKCDFKNCPLWKYRTGHRPKDAISENNISDEEIIEEDISE